MEKSVLTRLDVRVLKDKSGSDPAQVPAANATLYAFRQGATASETRLVPVGVPASLETQIPIYDPGELMLGDSVQVGAGGPALTVSRTPSPTEVWVTNPSTIDSVTVLQGSRLIPTASPPVIYAGPRVSDTGPSHIDTDANGLAGGYVAKPRFDYVVAGGGLAAARAYVDVVGGTKRSPSWLNAKDFPSIQAAVSALPPTGGGEIFMPAGTYPITSGITIDRPGVTFRGEGPQKTIIKGNGSPNFDLITVNDAFFKMYDLMVDGFATAPSTIGKGNCLLINGPAFAGGKVVEHTYLQNVVLQRGAGYGVTFREGILVVAVNSRFEQNKLSGIRAEAGATTLRFIQCRFGNNEVGGAEIDNATAITFLGCLFENNLGKLGPVEGNALDMQNLDFVQVIGCSFAKSVQTSATPEQYVFALGGRAPLIEGCWFDGGTDSPTRPKRAAALQQCLGAQFSNNTAVNLNSGVGTRLLDLQDTGAAGPFQAIEFGNRDGGTLPRINVGSTWRLFGLSRGVVEIPKYPAVPPASSHPEGSLIWVPPPQQPPPPPALDNISGLKVRSQVGWQDIATET